MKRILYVFLSWMLFSIQGWAQNSVNNHYFTIDNIDNEYFSIPWVKNTQHPKVVERINQTIQMNTVGCLYKVKGEEKFFEEMMPLDGTQGTVGLDYVILINTPEILSIAFTKETNAAYPDTHYSYLNFNAATGHQIELDELFTPNGLLELHILAARQYNRAIREFYQTAFDRGLLQKGDYESRGKVLLDLMECNTSNRISFFGVQSGDIVVRKDRCFAHVAQIVDIDWETTVRVDHFNKEDLTALGEALLVDKKPIATTHYSKHPNRMEIHGRIDGKYAFTMNLYFDVDSAWGSYWYNHNGGFINIEVKQLSPDTIEVSEDGAKFLFKIQDDGTLTGHWTKSNGKRYTIAFD
ncbi:hypothetical protein K5X82_03245 [Halosquirtibacter xylanolyticus]|uniref:hypothetical protein n=1 Tax=Halosquirtibacter xylanolyticus TaxID=3374599 RepID=UPI003747E672|nr:hypothetical protein K5X82_03245 [Prolixibacteraceae bacterium]